MTVYKIVEFSDNGGVAVVLSDWMPPRKSQVFWAPYKDQTTFDKALKKQAPLQESWKVFAVARVFYERDNLDIAYKKAKKAELSSNLETDDEEIPRKRKIKLRHLNSSDEEEELSSQHKRPPKVAFKKKADSIDVRIPPKKPNLFPDQTSITDTGSSLSELIATPISTPNDYFHNKPSASNANSQTVTPTRQSLTNNLKEAHSGPSEIAEKDSVLHCLSTLKEQNKKILSILKAVQDKVFANLDETNHEVFNIPVSTIDGLKVLEDSLDEVNAKKLIKCCQKFGGDGVVTRTNRILKELITDDVAIHFSFKGKRNDKRPFCNLKLKRVIVDAVKNTTSTATDTEVEACIKVWLKHSPQRLKVKAAKDHHD